MIKYGHTRVDKIKYYLSFAWYLGDRRCCCFFVVFFSVANFIRFIWCVILISISHSVEKRNRRHFGHFLPLSGSFFRFFSLLLPPISSKWDSFDLKINFRLGIYAKINNNGKEKSNGKNVYAAAFETKESKNKIIIKKINWLINWTLSSVLVYRFVVFMCVIWLWFH